MNRFLQIMMLGLMLTAVTTTPASATDIYIFGENVNDRCWEFAQQDAKMTETSPNVYEWDGSVLGARFMFNDGTLDNNYLEGTEIIANIGAPDYDGNPVLDEPFTVCADPNAVNISFPYSFTLYYPHVVLDLNSMTVCVSTDAKYYLYGFVSENEFHDEWSFKKDEESGLYRLSRAYFPPIPNGSFHSFFILSNGYQEKYGGNHSDTPYYYLMLEPATTYKLSTDSDNKCLGIDHSGIYDIYFDPINSTIRTELVEEIINHYDFKLIVTHTDGTRESHDIKEHRGLNSCTAGVVKLSPGDELLLSDDNGYVYGLTESTAILSTENPNHTLNLFTPSNPSIANTLKSELDGLYNVILDFSTDSVLLHVESLNYGTFKFQFGDDMRTLPLEPTEESDKYSLTAIHLTPGVRFALINDDRQYFAADSGNPIIISDSDLDCELRYWDGSQDWYADYAYSTLDGYYDIIIRFDNDKAFLSFEKGDDIDFDLRALKLKVHDIKRYPLLYYPTEVNDFTAVYKGIELHDGERILLESEQGTDFGLRSLTSITPENKEVTMEDSYSYYLPISIDGTYDISVTFNKEYSEAYMVFNEPEMPQEVKFYEGDLYLVGDVNHWKPDDEKYHMTCVEPGIYEWNGDMLSSGFRIDGGSGNHYFPNTNLYLSLGSIYDDIIDPCENREKLLEINTPYQIKIGGQQIYLGNKNDFQFREGDYIKNVRVILNLHDMTLLVTGDHCIAPIDLTTVKVMLTDKSTSHSITPTPQLTAEGLAFENIRLDGTYYQFISASDARTGTSTYALLPWGYYPEITTGNLEIDVYSSRYYQEAMVWVQVCLKGVYTMFVTFNEDYTRASVRYEKVAELESYINISMENGYTHSISGAYGEVTEVSVATNDEYWGIAGYTINGEVVMFENLQPTCKQVLTFGAADTHIVYHTEYLGECKAIAGTTGTVEFDNAITITKIPDGVEIRNIEVGEEIAVYTLGGHLVGLFKATDPEMTIRLENNQSFIVRAGKVAAKVMMQ